MRRTIALSVIVALVLALAAESAARSIEPGLSSAGAWPKGGIAEQFDSVSVIARRGPVDVVFAGSSMVEKGIDPELFTRITGLRSFNAALPASTNFMLEPWLMKVVVPKLHPRVVAIGIASRDFNDNGNGPEKALKAFVTAPGYQSIVAKDWLTNIDRRVSRYSALVRARRSMREPSNLIAAIGRREPPIKTLPCPPKDPRFDRYVVDETVARYPLTLLNRYSVGGIQTRALLKTIRELQRRGIDVVLMKLPTSPDYRGLHPDPDANLAEYRTAFEHVVETTHVTVIDGTSLTSRRYFRDPIHLNCVGAATFSTMLTNEWSRLSGAQPRARGRRADPHPPASGRR